MGRDERNWIHSEDYPKMMEFTVENSWIGCIIADADGKYVYTNKIYESITGIPGAEMVGSSVEAARQDGLLGPHSTTILAMKEKKEVVAQQQLKDRRVIVRGTPYFDEKGKVKYVLSQLFSIEKLNRLYQEIAREKKKGWEHFEKVELRASQVSEGSTDYIIYRSEEMSQVMDQARRLAPTDVTVLLLGESGTGKELVAKFIHQASSRKEQPFIRINCSAIPENLLESELFGYEAGSFTGGSAHGRKGLLEHANGGTVLLDEIGDMPYPMQSKILRVLQEKEIMRIGGNQPIRLDIRFIAATNRNIPELIREKQFRSDLYHRLNMAPLRIPALRQRKEDIPLLIEYFLSHFNQEYQTAKGMDQKLSAALSDMPFYGNIRELRNLMERLMILSPGNELSLEDFQQLHLEEDEGLSLPDPWGIGGKGKSLEELLRDYEENIWRTMAQRHKKNADIAAALKVHPSTVTRKLQQFGIR